MTEWWAIDWFTEQSFPTPMSLPPVPRWSRSMAAAAGTSRGAFAAMSSSSRAKRWGLSVMAIFSRLSPSSANASDW